MNRQPVGLVHDGCRLARGVLLGDHGNNAHLALALAARGAPLTDLCTVAPNPARPDWKSDN